MNEHYRRLQRHTTARSVFDWIALICLGASLAFWLTLHWAWLSPPALLSMQSIVAIVMGLIYSLVTPLLWSAMAPSTPAGMMLQRTQTRTWGFVVMLGACGFLTWHGWRLIWSWWMAQPNVAETGEAMSLAIACLIGFVVVPALAWTATTPEQWMKAVEQAHAVHKLALQQKGELAIIKASLIRAETLAAIGWANLLPLEKEEAIGSLRGLLMGSADSMRAVVKTLGMDAQLTRSIMSDDEIADQLDYVTKSIDVVPEIAPPAREFTTAIVNSGIPETTQPQGAHVNSRLQSSIPRDDTDVSDATRRQATPGDAAYLRAARDAFGRRPWTLKQLAAELKIGDTSAGELRDAWLENRSCRTVNLGRWTFDTQ